MSENQKLTQQEIAPLDNSSSNNEVSDAPAEKKSKRGIFFRLPDPTKKAAYLGIMIALAIVIKILAIDVPGGKISFFYLPVFLTGIFFGPVSGFIVGFLADILGTVFGGKVPLIILSFGNGLSGAIMGLFFMLRTKPAFKISFGLVVSLIVVTLGVNTFGLSSMGGDFSVRTYLAYLFFSSPPRVLFQPIVMAVNAMLLFPLYYALRRVIEGYLGDLKDF